MRDLDVLMALEEEKRSLDPGDPKLVELAERVDDIARRILGGATRQHSLTEVVHRQVVSGATAAPTESIAATPRSIPSILAEWRDAERRLAVAEPGSDDESEAQALDQALRDEYRAAQDATRGRRS
jgi:hypothetical protein